MFLYWLKLALNISPPLNDRERRNTKIGQGASTALLSKGIGLISAIISIPLTVKYLGAERYGIWVTIVSLVGWFSIADLGLGYGLINDLSVSYAKDERMLAQQQISTTFWLQILVALVGLCLCMYIWGVLEWATIFNLKTLQAQKEVTPTLGIALIIFWVNFPLGILSKVYGAYQETFLDNLWTSANNVISLVALLVVIWGKGGLFPIVLAVSGTLLFVNSVNACWLFCKHKPWLFPAWKNIDLSGWRRLTATSGTFFAIQVANLVVFQGDNIIISHYLGAEQVTPYNVTWRLFNYAMIVQSLIFPSLWPAYAEAFAQKDYIWLKNTFRKNIFISVLSTLIPASLLIVFGKSIINYWAGPVAVPSQSLLFWMGAWSLGSVTMNSVVCFLNGAGKVRGQMFYSTISAICNIFLSIILVVRWGTVGVIAASVVTYVLLNLVPASLEARLILNQELKITSA